MHSMEREAEMNQQQLRQSSKDKRRVPTFAARVVPGQPGAGLPLPPKNVAWERGKG